LFELALVDRCSVHNVAEWRGVFLDEESGVRTRDEELQDLVVCVRHLVLAQEPLDAVLRRDEVGVLEEEYLACEVHIHACIRKARLGALQLRFRAGDSEYLLKILHVAKKLDPVQRVKLQQVSFYLVPVDELKNTPRMHIVIVICAFKSDALYSVTVPVTTNHHDAQMLFSFC
jgi:hypothetical protein